ncbi:MAG: hypothetical protein IPO95_00860 [Rhodanobacteraceae bacterium]|nr:hypothetical protein [Rhodanobacteraceae bacterium]
MKCNPAVATIAIDLAKSVFQVLAVDQDGRAIDSHRLSRAQFIAFWQNRAGAGGDEPAARRIISAAG